jgi:PAS domain S-box-containing protein
MPIHPPSMETLLAENADLRARLAHVEELLRLRGDEKKPGPELLVGETAFQHQHESLFSALVDLAPLGVYVVDAQFRLQQVNSLALPAFAKVDARAGRDFGEVMHILWGREVGDQIIKIFRHTLATGERFVSPRFSEFRQDLGENRAYEWEIQRVTLPDGQQGVVCYFNDITERIRSQQALLESEERSRLATEVTGVGIWEWNILTGQVRWDAQVFRIYGLAPTADGLVTYELWRERLVAEDLPEQEEILGNIIGGLPQGVREFRIRRATDGEIRHIHAFDAVRKNHQDRIEWVVGTNLDITGRRRAEQSLLEAKAAAEAANLSKDQFLAALSHELRTPLTPVLIAAESLREDERLPADVREQLGMMERNIALEARLIDDLLDITAVSQGKVRLRPEPFDAHGLIKLVLAMVRNSASAKGVSMVCAFATPHGGLVADPTRFQQVIWNLLRNAVKFTGPGGRINIHTRTATAPDKQFWLRVEVADSGIGIEPAALAKIFNPFEQGSVTGDHRFGGIGLGLAIAKAIVDLHSGRIWAESAGLNQGSTFVVEFPGATLPPRDVAPPPVLSSAQNESTVPLGHLLLVEDHEPTRQVIANLLTRSGYRVVAAGCVADALTAAAADSFDLVISDLGLPDGSGIQLMDRLRSQHGLRGVALSGYGMEDDIERTRHAGFVAHLTKPVHIAELRKVLATLAQDFVRR